MPDCEPRVRLTRRFAVVQRRVLAYPAVPVPLEVRLASLFKNVTLTESDRLNGPPFRTHPRV